MKPTKVTSDLSFRSRVLSRTENEGISPTFAMLLIGYEEQANRMEAYYRDISINKEVRKEKLRDTFGLSRNEANRLSRLYEATR